MRCYDLWPQLVPVPETANLPTVVLV